MKSSIYTLLYLASFTYHEDFEVHLCHFTYQSLVPFWCTVVFYCMDSSFFVHLSTSWWIFFTYFWCLASMNNIPTNISIQVFVRTYVFIFLGWRPRSGIAGLNSKLMFNFLRNCQTFPSGNFSIPTSSKQGFQFVHLLNNPG